MTCKNCIHFELCSKMISETKPCKYFKKIEKDIAWKPYEKITNRGIDVSGERDVDTDYICPSCGAVVGNCETEDIFYNFCPECGIKIDDGMESKDNG